MAKSLGRPKLLGKLLGVNAASVKYLLGAYRAGSNLDSRWSLPVYVNGKVGCGPSPLNLPQGPGQLVLGFEGADRRLGTEAIKIVHHVARERKGGQLRGRPLVQTEGQHRPYLRLPQGACI